MYDSQLSDKRLTQSPRTLLIEEKRPLDGSTVQPYTLIVRNARLALQGSMTTNALYVVPEAQIIFQHQSCDTTEHVHGMFMAGQ